MSSWEQIKEIKGLLASLVGAFTVVSIIGLALMDWRISVHVTTAVDNAFAKNLAGNLKIVNMDTSIADNKRTGDENAEDILQNRRNNELAMFRLLGLPPPEDPTTP
ncbi:MAG: hypothetical protein KAQ88_09640 [Hyphomicrobiaceae bacterium]|nr:hypothetical protein [Hyphomicrobiaceae bacterium]